MIILEGVMAGEWGLKVESKLFIDLLVENELSLENLWIAHL